MKNTLTMTTELNLVECGRCGAAIALSKQMERTFRDTHQNFYCPAGHSQHYPAKTATDRLADELKASEWKRERDQDKIADLLKKLYELSEENKRIERQARASVCPECDGSFVELARHQRRVHEPQTAEARA